MATPIAIRRLTRDLRMLQKEPLDSSGIFYYANENNMFNGQALIIGPENTPYHHGFYFFDFYFPDNYPFQPPKVSYETRCQGIRFNPNLYTCGKVCVSILNTWSGPQWTSCQSIKSILLSLQTILCNNPIHNEPGYEKELGDRCQKYNQVIQYHNFKTAIYGMLLNPPPKFEVFLPVMKTYFHQQIESIIENIDLSISKSPKMSLLISPMYGMTVKIDYVGLKNDLNELYHKQTGKNLLNSSNKEIKSKKKRKAPSISSSNFDIGYEINSNNDENYVYIVSTTKTGQKRWKKKKPYTKQLTSPPLNNDNHDFMDIQQNSHSNLNTQQSVII